MQHYVNHMRVLYFEVSGKHLLDSDGRVRHFPDKPTWENVVATAPVYMMQQIKSKKKDFGALARVAFRSVCPSHETGCTAFKAGAGFGRFGAAQRSLSLWGLAEGRREKKGSRNFKPLSAVAAIQSL